MSHRLLHLLLRYRRGGDRPNSSRSQTWRGGDRRISGFTLLELLVVAIIAGGIVSGLLYIVNELLQADARESALSETQREMQLALDYMSNELKEAIYVYTGTCLDNGGNDASGCPGLEPYLPASLDPASNGGFSVPVLAFWKSQPLPIELRRLCAGTTPPTGVPCATGSSYALVVYSIQAANATERIWQGRARITRYALEAFETDGTPTPGYVNPGSFRGTPFTTWPLYADPAQNNTVRNWQTTRPTGAPVVLVDFVDNGRASRDPALPVRTEPDPNAVPADAICTGGREGEDPTATTPLEISPAAAALDGTRFQGVRSFYACVSRGASNTAGQFTSAGSPRFSEVTLYLRGNASGRPSVGFNDNRFLPTLETRVLSRSGLRRNETTPRN